MVRAPEPVPQTTRCCSAARPVLRELPLRMANSGDAQGRALRGVLGGPFRVRANLAQRRADLSSLRPSRWSTECRRVAVALIEQATRLLGVRGRRWRLSCARGWQVQVGATASCRQRGSESLRQAAWAGLRFSVRRGTGTRRISSARPWRLRFVRMWSGRVRARGTARPREGVVQLGRPSFSCRQRDAVGAESHAQGSIDLCGQHRGALVARTKIQQRSRGLRSGRRKAPSKTLRCHRRESSARRMPRRSSSFGTGSI